MTMSRPMKCCTIPFGEEESYVQEMIKRSGYVFASVKMDGYRCRNHLNYPTSSTGKVIRNLHIRREFLKAKLVAPFDGELIVDPFDFQKTQSGITTLYGEPNFFFWVFDIVGSEPFAQRVIKYTEMCSYMNAPYWLLPIKQTICTSVKAVLDFEQSILSLGHEGVILKSPCGIYKHGRVPLSTYNQVKLVRYRFDEARITGFIEEMENTNEQESDNFGLSKRPSYKDGKVGKNTLGSLEVVGLSGEHKDKVFHVGTGENLTKILKKQIWNDKSVYMNKIIRYKWKPKGTDVLPRQPVLTAFL